MMFANLLFCWWLLLFDQLVGIGAVRTKVILTAIRHERLRDGWCYGNILWPSSCTVCKVQEFDVFDEEFTKGDVAR